MTSSRPSQKIRLLETGDLRTKPQDEAFDDTWLAAKKQRKALRPGSGLERLPASPPAQWSLFFCLSAGVAVVAVAAVRLPKWLMQTSCGHRAVLPPSVGPLLPSLACPTQILTLGVTRVSICATAGKSSPRFFWAW